MPVPFTISLLFVQRKEERKGKERKKRNEKKEGRTMRIQREKKKENCIGIKNNIPGERSFKNLILLLPILSDPVAQESTLD